MKVLSIAELLCLTRSELLELRRFLELQIQELPADSSEYRDSVETLANVRLVLIRIDRRPIRPSP